MRVLIAGAGIGGLATALSLSAAGVADADLVEAAPRILPLGVGINVLPHAVRELHELGFADHLAAAGIESRSITYFDRHGSRITTLPRGTAAGYDWPAYFFHRGAFQLMLLRGVREQRDRDPVRTRTRLVRATTSAGAAIAELDSPRGRLESRADLLVAADGVNSTARASLYPNQGAATWNGNVMYRGVTRLDGDFLDGHSMIYGGHFAQRFLAYPIRDPAGEIVLNWGATLASRRAYLAPEDWNREVAAETVAEEYRGWRFEDLDLSRLIADADVVYEYPQVDREPLPQWSFGRVTLLGDAAHPMQPAGSNGTSQAILDARVLAAQLATAGSVEQALRGYDDRRIEATSRVVLANRAMADAKLLQTVYERAPHGFDNIDEVMSQDEIRRSVLEYQRLAGFDPEGLRARPSLTVG